MITKTHMTKEEFHKLHMELTLACRKEAIARKDKAYIRRCNRLLKKLSKGPINEFTI